MRLDYSHCACIVFGVFWNPEIGLYSETVSPDTKIFFDLDFWLHCDSNESNCCSADTQGAVVEPAIS